MRKAVRKPPGVTCQIWYTETKTGRVDRHVAKPATGSDSDSGVGPVPVGQSGFDDKHGGNSNAPGRKAT